MTFDDEDRREDQELAGYLPDESFLRFLEEHHKDSGPRHARRMREHRMRLDSIGAAARRLLDEHGPMACGQLIQAWVAADEGAELLLLIGWQAGDMSGIRDAFNRMAFQLSYVHDGEPWRARDRKLAVTMRLAALVAVRTGIGPKSMRCPAAWQAVMRTVDRTNPAPLDSPEAWAVAEADAHAVELACEEYDEEGHDDVDHD